MNPWLLPCLRYLHDLSGEERAREITKGLPNPFLRLPQGWNRHPVDIFEDLAKLADWDLDPERIEEMRKLCNEQEDQP